jgi:outer membrane protein assembly factor BamB
LIVSVVLVACGVGGVNSNWPGLSADGSRVYIAYGPGVIAYDVETREQAWSFTPESGRAPFYAAPSVQDGLVIVGDYGESSSFSPEVNVNLYWLDDTRTGAQIAQATELSSGSVVASPLQVGDRIFVGTADNLVYAFDAESRQPSWSEPFETGHSIWGKPAYSNGLLFVNSLDKTVYAIDAETGVERWHQTLTGAIASAPVVNEDLVYVAGFDSQLHAFSLESGEEKWTVSAEDWIWGAPAYSQGMVYFADAKGNVYAVDGGSGEQAWTYPLGTPIQTSPVVLDGIVYIGAGDVDPETDEEIGTLTALTTVDGEPAQLWQETTPAPVYTTPVIVGDALVVAVPVDTLTLKFFDLGTGEKKWEDWTISPPGDSS